MTKPGILLVIVIGSFAFQGCKITAPTGNQVAEPVRIGEMKGPLLLNTGKMFFLEDKAVYQPNPLALVSRRKKEIHYTEIDTVEGRRFYGIMPITALINLKNGKKFRIRVNKRNYLIKTLNNLKQ